MEVTQIRYGPTFRDIRTHSRFWKIPVGSTHGDTRVCGHFWQRQCRFLGTCAYTRGILWFPDLRVMEKTWSRDSKLYIPQSKRSIFPCLAGPKGSICLFLVGWQNAAPLDPFRVCCGGGLSLFNTLAVIEIARRCFFYGSPTFEKYRAIRKLHHIQENWLHLSDIHIYIYSYIYIERER